jgi:hypothetical protein
MKALNRQQRRAAIWNFVLLYLITVFLIVLPFVLMDKLANAQYRSLKEEIKADIENSNNDQMLDKLRNYENTLGNNIGILATNSKPDAYDITQENINRIRVSNRELKKLKEEIEKYISELEEKTE